MEYIRSFMDIFNHITKPSFSLKKNVPSLKTSAVTIFIAFVSYKWITWFFARQKIKSIIQEKRHCLRLRKEGLRHEFDKLDAKNIEIFTEIVNLNVRVLLEQLREGELKPLDVLRAYQYYALKADDVTHCICDFILEAEKMSTDLEQIEPQKRGSLYGLPVSVKECFFVEGYVASIGLAKYMTHPSDEDASIIKHLKSLHAIPFCLTNIPQTMKSIGCSNPLYGETLNPHDLNRTCGGSSGGEAALIAMKGSPVGIGSDIGGSLRTPSHNCGISSIKVTTNRLSNTGRRSGGSGRVVGVHPKSGFMSSNVDSLVVTMQAILEDPSKFDSEIVPLHWNENAYLRGSGGHDSAGYGAKKLRIGWYDDFAPSLVTPGCKRGVHVAKSILTSQGHTLVDCNSFIDGISHEAFSLYFNLMLGDGNKCHKSELSLGEIFDKSIWLNVFKYHLPLLFTPIMSLIARYVIRSPTIARMVACGPKDTAELWCLYDQSCKLKTQFLKWLDEMHLDCIIGPGSVNIAPLKDYTTAVIPAVPMSGMYNIMDLPVGLLGSVTFENEEDQRLLESEYGREDDSFYKVIKKVVRGGVGMPIGVQVIGRPYSEELILGVMKQMENVLKSEVDDF